MSRSGFYGWRRRPKSKRAKQDEGLIRHIKCIHQQNRELYGAELGPQGRTSPVLLGYPSRTCRIGIGTSYGCRAGRLVPGYPRAQPTPEEAEVKQLRAVIKRLEMENEILKKASTYEAQNQR